MTVQYDDNVWGAALVASLLSMAASALIVYLCFHTETLRTFPARLNFWLVANDLVWFSSAALSIVVSAATRFDMSGHACTVLGPVYHAASLVSIGMFCIIAYNLASMVGQSSVEALETRATLLARSVIACAAIVVVAIAISDAGGNYLGTGAQFYVPTAYGSCFVSPVFPGLRLGTQTLPAALAGTFVVAAYATSARSVSVATHGAQAASVRRRIVKRGSAYVAGFALCWAPALIEDAVLLGAAPGVLTTVPGWLVYTKAVLFFGQGVWNAVVFLINKWPRLRHELAGVRAGRCLLAAVQSARRCTGQRTDPRGAGLAVSAPSGGAAGGYGAVLDASYDPASAVFSPERRAQPGPDRFPGREHSFAQPPVLTSAHPDATAALAATPAWGRAAGLVTTPSDDGARSSITSLASSTASSSQQSAPRRDLSLGTPVREFPVGNRDRGDTFATLGDGLDSPADSGSAFTT